MISGLKESIALVRRLAEIAKNMQHVELKGLIAELANKLADANMQMAGLKNEIAILKEENNALKNKVDGEKPKVRWGCYEFDGDENLYCPACFDTKGKKHLTARAGIMKRRCSVCQTELS